MVYLDSSFCFNQVVILLSWTQQFFLIALHVLSGKRFYNLAQCGLNLKNLNLKNSSKLPLC